MREAVQRITDPLLARIPDYSRDPLQRQVAIGLAIAAVIHLILFILAAGVLYFTLPIPGFKNVDEEKPLEIQLVAPRERSETERMQLDEKKAREILLSKGLESSTEKPDNPDFESDQDMKAGSELPATGLLPVPSQEGRTDLPGMSFAKQDVILGATENAASSLFQAPKGNEPPRAIFKPQPLTQAQLDAANEAGPTAALPKVAATPAPRFEDRLKPATPAPLRKVPQPGENELAISTTKPNTPVPVPKGPDTLRPDVVDAPLTRPPMATPAPMQMARLSTPPPASAMKGYRENLEKTQIEGSISNRGRPGVNAVGTPLAKYMKGVSSLVGSRWQILVARDREWLALGSVRLRFTILPDGRIDNVVVEANDSNRNFADVCVQAVRDSKLDPLPPEATEQLRDGRLEIPFTFTLYSTN
jgi:TonB family protein